MRETAGDPSRIEDYEARSAGALVALAFAFLGLYAAQILWLSMPEPVAAALNFGQYVIWTVFIADFVYRVYLSPRRGLYIASHPLDLVTLVLPMLRPLRALRIFAAARVLIERGHHISYGRVAASIAAAAGFVVLVGALVVLDFERYAPDSSITTFGQALWWGVVTITTVGYGDVSPVTAGGQVSATLMMVVGISLIGAVTATFAGWFTDRVRGGQKDANRELAEELAAIRSELTQLRGLVGAAHGGVDPGSGTTHAD